jgi:hypothetical protein
MRAALLLVVGCAACGSSSPTAPPARPAGPPAALVAPGAGSGDVIVATVNGRPVWGSCVAVQHSLDQCVGFELMAQAAEQRGLALDPDVALATRTAMVSRLVEDQYEARHFTPAELGAAWTDLVEKRRYQWDHNEVRGSHYVRVPAEKVTPEQDAAAHALADQIAAAAAANTGWLPSTLDEAADKIAAGRPIQKADVPFKLPSQLVEPYAKALFAIPQIGSTSPAVRTQWGWDVILYTAVLPATHPTEAQLEQQLMPGVKERYFSVWVHQLELAMGLHVEENPKALEDLPE